jgi:hypothetical protein
MMMTTMETEKKRGEIRQSQMKINEWAVGNKQVAVKTQKVQGSNEKSPYYLAALKTCVPVNPTTKTSSYLSSSPRTSTSLGQHSLRGTSISCLADRQ